MSDWGDLEYDTTIHQWETIEIGRRVFILTLVNLTFNQRIMILLLNQWQLLEQSSKLRLTTIQLCWLFPWCHDQTGVTSGGNEASCHVTSLPGVRIMRPWAGNTQWSSWPGHGLSLALLWAKKRGMWRYGQQYSRLSPLKCSCGFLMTPAVWQGYSWPMTQWPVGWNSSLFRQFLLETRVNERESQSGRGLLNASSLGL